MHYWDGWRELTIEVSFGKVFSKTGDALLLIEGTQHIDATAHPKASPSFNRIFALLSMPSYKPVFEDLSICIPLDADVSQTELPFPFFVEVEVAPL